MIIRQETEKDYFEVENLTREAFWNVYRPGAAEHLVVHNLRSTPYYVKELDYVLEENGQIVASIFYAKATIVGDDGIKKETLIFGPVCVRPDLQKRGYGKMLIEYTLKKAKDLGYASVIISGNPDYYQRFGFKPCSDYSIYYEGLPKTEPAPFFIIKVLDEEAVKTLNGTYSDPECYFPTEEEIERFDEKFPKKKKEKLDTQLF